MDLPRNVRSAEPRRRGSVADELYGARRIERFLRTEAKDPNKTRIPLPERSQMGIHRWA